MQLPATPMPMTDGAVKNRLPEIAAHSGNDPISDMSAECCQKEVTPP